MATIDKKNQRKIEYLYNAGLSVKDIATQLKVSIDAVYYFFRKNKIARRSPQQNSKLQFEKRPSSFHVKDVLTPKLELLKIAGVCLYWGEGSQWCGEKIVDFVNSKPEMIKVFLKFLRDVCCVDERKFRVYIYCHQNQDLEKIVAYWSRVTKIPNSQFTKPYICGNEKIDKMHKMPNGLIHVRYYDKKLLIQIRKWIDEAAVKLGE